MSARGDNVVAFPRRGADAGYAPGVVPFDAGNAAHVRAWNALFALGQAEAQKVAK